MSKITTKKESGITPGIKSKGIFDLDLLELGIGINIPSANISESDKSITFELAAPGLKREDFKVKIENNFLTVKAKKEETETEKTKNWKRKEYSYYSFERSFFLQPNLDLTKKSIKYEDGVLSVEFPKLK